MLNPNYGSLHEGHYSLVIQEALKMGETGMGIHICKSNSI